MDTKELGYKEFKKGIDDYDIQQQRGAIKKAGSKKTSGKGYPSGSGLVENASVTCPGNVLSDISRLEVLIGRKRAGNNSREIINEAVDICRRLFACDIMDIDVYRTLIDEFVDGYHSD